MEDRHRRLLVKQNPWWTGEQFNPPAFERDLLAELLKYAEHKQMIAIIGLRRVGKTVLMQQIIKRYSKIQNNVCYISFDDIDFQKYETAEDLVMYFLEFSDKKKMRYLFLDEIQKLPNWADMLKVLYDTENNLKIFLSGSVSLELKKYKETLAGRILEFHLPVFSFKEFARYHKTDYEVSGKNMQREYDLKYACQKEKYLKLFEKYLLKGAFPELLETDDVEYVRKYIKEALIEKTIADIAKDARENEKIIYELFRLLAGNSSELFEITNIAGTLKINRNLASAYIHLLERAFLIKISRNYTASVAKQIRANKKQYCVHPSVIMALFDYSYEVFKTPVAGKLVESAIANSFENASFWRTPQKDEVDIIARVNNQILPIEVKYQNQVTQADLGGLLKFMDKFKCKRGILVTKDKSGAEILNGKKIEYIPAWLFLLIPLNESNRISARVSE